jgi:probable rRNA maturation factor
MCCPAFIGNLIFWYDASSKDKVMAKIEINIIVKRSMNLKVSKSWIQKVARQVLEAESIRQPAEMGLLITDVKGIQRLNRIYRGKDEPTDVLSFQIAPDGDQKSELTFVNAPDGIRHLGEVIISYPQALKQAQERGHSVAQELALLIIHGTLHLLGYDHQLPAEAGRMRNRESEIIASLKTIK